MAISERYAIISRKLNKKEDNDILKYEVERCGYLSKTSAFDALKENPVYSILDLKQNLRSTDNLLFSEFDYFSETDCEKAISHLENNHLGFGLSTRNITKISIDWNRTISDTRENKLNQLL